LIGNSWPKNLNPCEDTLGALALLEMRPGKRREEVMGLLHRMWNEAQGKITRNVAGSPEAQAVEETFRLLRLPGDLGEPWWRPDWESSRGC